MIKAVFIDFDGTLYSHKSNLVPESTVIAINEALKNNIKVILCTGRSPEEVFGYNIPDIRFSGYVFYNGGMICGEDRKPFIINPVTDKVKNRIIDLFNANYFPISLGTLDGIYFNYINDFAIESLKTISTNVGRVDTYKGEELMFAGMFYENESNYHYIDDIRSEINEFFWADKTADIFSKNISKAIGIDYILDYFKIDISETMGIGDSENDTPMLQHCNLPVAMGNASEYIKKISKFTTSDVDDGGILNAFINFKLI